MENIMPIVSVGIDRAMFATRPISLVFDDGTLQTVCISKGSEVAGFIDIPLDIVYGMIALPSQTLQVTFDDLRISRELKLAQQRLQDAQQQYLKLFEYHDGGDGATIKKGYQKISKLDPGPGSGDISLQDICAKLKRASEAQDEN